MLEEPVAMNRERAYRQRLVLELEKLLKLEDDWKATADYLEEMVVENGLLPVSATPLNRDSPFGFAVNLIEDQDLLRENGNLINLQLRNWSPASAENAEDLVLHLLI
jgi:hypothetical protein